ncbi:MAG: CsgG/HfaB family protein [Cyanobacteria bacterium J06648_11]
MTVQRWRAGVMGIAWLGLSAIAGTVFTLEANAQGDRLRVAVLDFDFGSTGAGAYFGGDTTAAAKGLNELLVNSLVDDGTYSVIERSQLEAVLQEQNLGDSGRLNASTAAQLGQILGVDALIMGTVTEYNLDVRESGMTWPIKVVETNVNATVQLNARMVSASTAEILVTSEGIGAQSQSDTEAFIVVNQTENARKLLSLAAEDAVDAIADDIIDARDTLAALPTAVPDITATVADVFGSEITLNRGSSDGLRPGMLMSVEQVVREVIDPETGDVLRKVTQPVGQLEIVEVSDRSSVGRTLSGVFTVGDVAKPVSDSQDESNDLFQYQQ